MTVAASTAWAVSLMPAVMPSTVSLNHRLKLLRDIGRTVGRNLQDGGRLRPVDLARGHGLSTQAIRNYEAAGILPGAERTPHGYRTYTPRHAQALRAFLALVPGHGHQTATSIMQAINRDADRGRAPAHRRESRPAARRPPHPPGRRSRASRPQSRTAGTRRHVRRPPGEKARHPPGHPAQMGTRRLGPAAPRPADGLPGLQRGRRTRRPTRPPAQTGRLPAGADRPADRPGPLRRRRRTARVDAARLACPPLGPEPRHAHRRRRTGRLPRLPTGPARRQAE